MTATERKSGEEVPADIDKLLMQFPDVFVEPTTLPPQRNHDHYIPLKAEASPVSIRPYMYNFFQKNEIEK